MCSVGISDRLKRFEHNPDIVEETSFGDFVTEALSKKIASIPVWYEYDYSKQFELILNFLDNKLNSEFEDLTLTDSEKRQIAEEFLKNNKGFGILDKLLADKSVEAVMVNSLGSVFINKGGQYIKTDLIMSSAQFAEIESRFKQTGALTRICQDNLVITILKPPVADNMLVIKKIKEVFDNLSDIADEGLITGEVRAYLADLLASKKNLIITGSDKDILDEFVQVLINSVNDSDRIAVIEDYMPFRALADNISVFSVASLKGLEWNYILESVKELKYDYTITALSDYEKFSSNYINTDEFAQGLITIIPAKSVSDVSSKLTDAAQRSLKCTEKQAKLKMSSLYDAIIQLEKLDDNKYCVSSVMEITSTKSSSLVMDEVVKYLDGLYVLDLPEHFYGGAEAPKDAKSSKTFRSRLKK